MRPFCGIFLYWTHCSDRAGRRTRRCSCCSGVSKRDASGYQFVCIMAATKCKTKKTSRRGSPATTTGATSASKAVATHIPTDTSNTGLTLCLATVPVALVVICKALEQVPVALVEICKALEQCNVVEWRGGERFVM